MGGSVKDLENFPDSSQQAGRRFVPTVSDKVSNGGAHSKTHFCKGIGIVVDHAVRMLKLSPLIPIYLQQPLVSECIPCLFYHFTCTFFFFPSHECFFLFLFGIRGESSCIWDFSFRSIMLKACHDGNCVPRHIVESYIGRSEF